MIPISFPIAYPDHLVYPHSSVSFVTLLLPQDDTSDVIPRHTMLRHAYHVSATRNFRLNPKEVSGLSSLDPTIILCITASMCSASRAGETSARATQEHASESARAHVELSLSLLVASGRVDDTPWFHVKQVSRKTGRGWGSRHAPSCPLARPRFGALCGGMT